MIKKACIMCGNEFEVYPSHAKRGGGKYCSIGCGTKFRNLTNNPTKDPNVRKKISENHADVTGTNNPMYGKNGKNAPNFKDGRTAYGSYYRMVAFTNKPSVCEECGLESAINKLQVHHIDKNRNNNELENLQILCYDCHAEKHPENRIRERGKDGRFLKTKEE